MGSGGPRGLSSGKGRCEGIGKASGVSHQVRAGAGAPKGWQCSQALLFSTTVYWSPSVVRIWAGSSGEGGGCWGGGTVALPPLPAPQCPPVAKGGAVTLVMVAGGTH